MEKTATLKNTVQTVLSERGVYHFECILRWFWDNFEGGQATKNLMKMLEVYIRHEPDDVHRFQKADWMTRFVCDLIELQDQLRDVQGFENPDEWIDTPDGWGLPTPETASE